MCSTSCARSARGEVERRERLAERRDRPHPRRLRLVPAPKPDRPSDTGGDRPGDVGVGRVPDHCHLGNLMSNHCRGAPKRLCVRLGAAHLGRDGDGVERPGQARRLELHPLMG